MARGNSPAARNKLTISAARNLRSTAPPLAKDMDVTAYPGKSRNHQFVGKLLLEAGADPALLLTHPLEDNADGSPLMVPAKKADSEMMTLNALSSWVPEVVPDMDGNVAHPELLRWAEDLQSILMQDGNHKAGHRFGLGEAADDEGQRTRFWYPSVAQAARGFYGLPSDAEGGILADGLIGAIRRSAYPTERTFTELIQRSPVRTLALSCDARADELEPAALAKALPGEAAHLAPYLAGAPVERRIAIEAAISLAAAEGLDADDTEAVVLAAAWSAPYGTGNAPNSAGAAGVSEAVAVRARALLGEVGPVGDDETGQLPVCTPTSPAGRVLADSLAAWMGHPQMDLVVDEQRKAMGLDDTEYGLALMERSRELCTRTKFHTKTGRAELSKRAKRQGTRLCDLMNFVDCGDRKNAAGARQLAPA